MSVGERRTPEEAGQIPQFLTRASNLHRLLISKIHSMPNLAAFLPLVALLTALVTISTSCSLAIGLGHVPSYPQISMCGIYPPERYVFSLGMTCTSLLLAGLLIINHVKTELLLLKTGSQPGSAVYSGTMLGIGMSSCLSLALMGTVSVGEMQIPHVIFAIAFFLLLVIFQFLNVASRIRGNLNVAGTSPSSSSISRCSSMVRLKELWMILWMLLTFVGFVMWQHSGQSTPQYLAVSSAMLHFFPYIWEMRDTELRIHVRPGSPEEEEAARCLRDDAMVPMRHSEVRGFPLVVAAGVVAVVVCGLAFVLSKL